MRGVDFFFGARNEAPDDAGASDRERVEERDSVRDPAFLALICFWRFLTRFSFQVRSHQCVPKGWEEIPCGEGKAIWTVFSASDYDGVGNDAAVCMCELVWVGGWVGGC